MAERPLLAGVIGAPIGHSKSPILHGYWLKKYAISGHYVPLHVDLPNLKETLELLPKLGFRGLNVTIPHKEAVLSLAGEVTARARAIGAANTLVYREDGSFLADNTDGYGFITNLQHSALHWSSNAGPALVLGAGGAARGVVWSLLDAGVPTVYLANRTLRRAEFIAADFGENVIPVEWHNASEKLEEVNLLVNTTSLGMTGGAPLELDLTTLRSDTLVTDIVYTPLQTELLRNAAVKGSATVDGLGMLLHQAAPGFEAWFGQKPDVDINLRNAVLNA